MKTSIDSLVAGMIPDAVVLVARIVTESAAAALPLEGGAAQVDNPDAETSENANLGSDVRYFLITFASINLTPFPPKLCMIRVRHT